MTNDDEWVADVKRWYRAAGSPLAPAAEATATDYGADLGYEAAHPALQACHWPDAGLTTDR